MQSLRRARFLARLVLAWFALTLGVAIAAPVLQPQAAQWLCTGAGSMKLVVPDSGGGSAAAVPTLDCPLCASFTAPLPSPIGWAARAQPDAHHLERPPAPDCAIASAAPPPGRGPPAAA